jgi:hypothetical protein
MSPVAIGRRGSLLAVAEGDLALLLYHKLDGWWITTLMATVTKGLLLRFSTTAPVVVGSRLQIDECRLFVKNDRFTHNTSPSISLLLVPVLLTLFASLFPRLAAERRQVVRKITQGVGYPPLKNDKLYSSPWTRSTLSSTLSSTSRSTPSQSPFTIVS